MRVLVLGGTGLTGPHIVRGLADLGHDVSVFHSSRRLLPALPGVDEIIGERAGLAGHRDAFASLRPEVVVHMMALTPADAELFLETFRGLVGRAVVISSGDVYRAFGRIHGTEAGPYEPVPLNEESPLRTGLSLGGAGYDKLGVEATLLSQSSITTTVLRYPAVYGPGDWQRRFERYARSMADRRPHILIGENQAEMRFSHGYCEDVAQAAVLATINDSASDRVYNVGESETPNERERIGQIGRAIGWSGEVRTVPEDRLPPHLSLAGLENLPGYQQMPDFRQALVIDSSKIRRELAYRELVPADEGLKRTADWLVSSATPGTKPDYEAEDAALG